MFVWRLKAKIIRAVWCLCTTVVHNDMHTHISAVLTVVFISLALGFLHVYVA